MQTRNQVASLVIGAFAAVAPSFADTPPASQQPADAPAAPAAPAPIENSDAQKMRKAQAIAVREAVKARMARCRARPETCRQ